ncbi:2682_t:CDS:10 [Rhizophagus irregularis]|nr:2682_t:CDS:10 [Rhizophagus irregularis]
MSTERRIAAAEALAKQFSRAKSESIDVTNEGALDEIVSRHDLVISLIPYTNHPLVLKSAIKFGKNVVTTSYVSPAMREFHDAAIEKNLTILNEIGLDPGIDHLYAVKTINEVHEADGEIVEIPGTELMSSAKPYFIYPAFAFLCYANRDSTPFKEYYNIPEAQNIVRGTLRYQGFTDFVKVLVKIGLLDDSNQNYLHFNSPEITWREVIAKVLNTSNNTEDELRKAIKSTIAENEISKDEIERILKGFKWLGLFSDKPIRRCGTLLDTLCATLEEKMQYEEGERDMVILQHKFEIKLKDGTRETWTSTLLEYGKPPGPSAMSTLVGIPCGIAVQLILDGVIKKRGVLAPYTPEIINPIIAELEKEGIKVKEEKL